MEAVFSSEAWRALLAALEILYIPVEEGNFALHAMQVVGMLFPGTIRSFDVISLADRHIESHVAGCDNPAEMQSRVLVHLMQNPVARALHAGGREPVYRLSDYISDRVLHRTDLYHECYKPIGIERQLAISLETPGYAGALTVNRPSRLDFTPEEQRLLALLRPHLVRAHANARLYSALRRENPGAAQGLDPVAMAREGLTRREAEVLRWVAEGKRDPEIALILGISPRTVQTHVANILAKLRVETRTAAVQAARR